MLALFVGLLVAQRAAAGECAGVTLEDTALVGGHPLVLNGMGLREATIFNVDVYVAGLYLPAPTRDPAVVVDDDVPKRLVMRFVREVGRADMDDAIRRSFASAAIRYGDTISRLSGMFPEKMREGDRVVFDYVRDAGMQVGFNGAERGTIRDHGFSAVFFGIFVGRNPPNEGLKRGLLGGPCD